MMPGRGRLLFPLLAEIARLDTVETEKDPDGAGPLTSGYDEDFQETIVREDPANEGERLDTRKENLVFVPAQVNSNVFEAIQMLASGNSPNSIVQLTFHFSDLERLGLVDPGTKQSRIRVNDRLVSLRDACSPRRVIERVPSPPGLYITEARPGGWMGNRNLLICTLQDRELGVRTA